MRRVLMHPIIRTFERLSQRQTAHPPTCRYDRRVIPFELPAPVALAAPTEELPLWPGWAFEPKIDGWRCLAHTRAGRLWSRHGTNLTTAFSDVAEAAQRLPEAVLDGELVALNAAGEIVFSRLQSRGNRGPKPGEDFTVHLAAFDLLATAGEDWRGKPYQERRAELLRILDGGPPQIQALPSSGDRVLAYSWAGRLGGGIEGAVAKKLDGAYRFGRQSGWLKWRQRHTVDAVVVGVTQATPAYQALVLAQPIRGQLRTVGVSLPIGDKLRAEIAPLLRPTGPACELPGTVGGLPGADPIPYLPVSPDLVVEIEADQAAPSEFGRFRHRPKAVRIRTDLQPDDL